MNIIGISGHDQNLRFKREEFPGLTPREYRIAQGFDSAAALVSSGEVVAASGEERFSREKATSAFPVGALRYCLDRGGITAADVDAVAHGFDYEPYEEYFGRTDLTRRQYDEVLSADVQRRLIAEAFPGTGLEEKLVPVSHHLAHAASSFYLSGFDDALVIVSDGMGEVHSMTAFAGSGDDLEVIRQIPALHSLGVLYGVVTLHLGFFMGLDEYKVMGLAPYGDPRRYTDRVLELISLKPDGTYSIPILAENKTAEEKETHRGVLRALADRFGPPRDPESEITQDHKDLAAALQGAFQTAQLHLLRTLRAETGAKNLCLAGGCALNCSCNGAVRRSRLFEELFVQPASGDDGPALGAALYVSRRKEPQRGPRARMSVPLWGPEFDDAEIERALEDRTDCAATRFDSFSELAAAVADRLAHGEVVAWFQGRMEFGPRALGSRSILADPTHPEMRDKINALVKKREGFRPFAPAVAAEAAGTYFEIDPGDESTYEHMLLVTRVRSDFRDKLPAITHVDGSARAQTVFAEHSPRFAELLACVGKTSVGIPMVLNTSFNVRGQPIVCTPTEAIDTFLMAGLDALAIGDWLVVPAGPE